MQARPVTVYAGLGHSQRFPDYWELFSGGNEAFGTLNPEKTTQLDMGMQDSHGALDAWISAYAGQIQDYILFDYTGMTRSGNINARIMGAETGVSYRWSERWRSNASLAWAWGENRSDGEPLPQMPPLEAQLSLSYEHGNFSATGLWRLVAAQSRVAEDKGNVVSRDFAESSGFGVLSVNAAWRVSRHFSLSAGVDNLLDKTYSEHLNQAGNAGVGLPAGERFNQPGRVLWLRLDAEF